MGHKKIEDVLGEEFRIAFEEKKAEKWKLEEALTKDWTDKENSPPEDSDFDHWAVTQSLTIYSAHNEIVNAIRREYNIRSDAHAVKRGLRYGLTTLYDEWKDSISQLAENRKVAGEVSEYIPRGGMYDRFDETGGLAVDWGKKVDRKSWRIIWNQKGFIKYLSKVLGVDEADIVRWSLIIVGDALGETGKIGLALQDEIEHILDEVEYRISDEAAKRRSDTRAIIADAISGEYGDQAASMLQEEYPAAWREFKSIASSQKALIRERENDQLLEYKTDFFEEDL